MKQQEDTQHTHSLSLSPTGFAADYSACAPTRQVEIARAWVLRDRDAWLCDKLQRCRSSGSFDTVWTEPAPVPSRRAQSRHRSPPPPPSSSQDSEPRAHSRREQQPPAGKWAGGVPRQPLRGRSANTSALPSVQQAAEAFDDFGAFRSATAEAPQKPLYQSVCLQQRAPPATRSHRLLFPSYKQRHNRSPLRTARIMRLERRPSLVRHGRLRPGCRHLRRTGNAGGDPLVSLLAGWRPLVCPLPHPPERQARETIFACFATRGFALCFFINSYSSLFPLSCFCDRHPPSVCPF